LVGYFLFFVLTQLKQIERSILYKFVNSLVIFFTPKDFLFESEEGKVLVSKLFDVGCLKFSKCLFLPNNAFWIDGSFSYYIKNMVNIIILLFTILNKKLCLSFLRSILLSLFILFKKILILFLYKYWLILMIYLN